MKNYAKTLLTGSVALLLLTACGSSKQQGESTQSDMVQSSQVAEDTQEETVQNNTIETVEFFATGEYEVGIDIEPGSYYIVLTEMNYASSDENQSAYVTTYVYDSIGDRKFYEGPIREIGKPYRVNLEEEDVIKFDDNYSPSGWTISFFTSEDYKEYQSSEKKSVTASSSSSTSSSSSVEKSSGKETELSPSSSEDSSTSDSSSETKTEVSSTSSEPVSDSEIESIKTYNDYLDVYGRIVNNYLDNYKAKMDEYGLADEATYAEMKKGVEEGVQQQKEAYGSIGNKKVVGKSDLVKFLKEYRDELQAFVDTVAQSLE